MASLTDQLSSPTAGKGVIATQVERPSFIAGLSKLVSGVDQAVSGLQAQRTQDATASRQAKEDLRKEGLLNAINSTESAATANLSQYEAPGMDLRTDTSSVWDATANKAVVELSATRKGVEQGRIPAAALALNMERVQADLFHQFPEFKSEIAKYMQERKFDTYMYRDQIAQQRFQDSLANSEEVAYTKQLNYAIERGTELNVDDPRQTAETGRRLMKEDAELGRLKKVRETQIAENVEGRTQSAFELERTEREISGVVTQQAYTKLGSIVTTFSTLVSAAGNDPTKLAKLSELISLAPGVFQSYKTAGSAQIQDVKIRKEFIEQIDTLEKSVIDIYSGPLSQIQVNKNTVENMSNQFAISFEQMMPIYSGLKKSIGTAAMSSIFGGTVPLPPEIKTAMAHEFAGLRTASADEGKVILNNMVQILKGNKQLKDMSEAEAIKQMPVLTRAAIATAKDVITDGGDPLALTTFSHSYSQLVIAATEIQKGATNTTDSVLGASSIVGSRESRQALEVGVQKDPERFLPLMTASRSSAVHLLSVARDLPTRQTDTTFYDVGYDERSGKYFSKFDDKKYDALIKKLKASPAGVPWTVRKDIPVPSDVSKKVDALNLNMSHLVRTAKYDEDIPKGTTELQLARHYHTGEPFVRTDSAGKPTTKSADQQFNESVDKFATELRVKPAEIQADPNMSFKGARISAGDAVSRFENYGVPKHIAAGIVGNLMAESSLNTGAVSTTTKGRKDIGLAQWEPRRRQHAVEQGFDLSDPNDAIDFVLWELKNTEPKAYTKLKEAKTSEEAARIFALHFLRPAGAQTGNADNIHNIAGRVKNAQSLG